MESRAQRFLREFPFLLELIDERIDANAETPSTPFSPVIGVASAGVESATVSFTPSSSGPTAESFTVVSAPGEITSTGPSSPLTVEGLTPGVSYIFKVYATNDVGNSAQSSASNSVVPTSSNTLPSDNFDRASSSSLGSNWIGDAAGTWQIISNKAESVSTGVEWNPVWMNAGQTDMLVQADFIFNERESGIVARVVDSDHLYYLDFNYESANTASGRIYMRNGTGSFTPLGDIGFTIPGMIAGQLVRLKLKCVGDTITAYVNKGSDLSVDNEVQQVVDSTITGEGAGIATLSSTAHTIVDNFVVTNP